MHASQSGTLQVPNEYLTTEDCVGCHSSSMGSTIVDIGSGDGASRVPIVFNTPVPSENTLAGGNFYWVTTDDILGHNLMGISDPDAKLGDDPDDPIVPGSQFGSQTNLKVSQCLTCHVNTEWTLDDPAIPWGIERDENYLLCQDCHQAVRHHATDPPPANPVVGEDNGWYRFIYGLNGIEDPDWEQSSNSTKHNEYLGETALWGGSISEFCGGCHNMYHRYRAPGHVGTGSP